MSSSFFLINMLQKKKSVNRSFCRLLELEALQSHVH